MVCSNCSNEINYGIKFCTKCGTKCNGGLINKNNPRLSYLSIILSCIGIIGIIIFPFISRSFGMFRMWRIFPLFLIFIFIGLIMAIITLYKQKNKLAFIVGLIPCIYFIIITLPSIFPFLRFLRFFGNLIYLAYYGYGY